MIEKKLHIAAIIPDNLYIQRDADRKLQDVILRMSKPAYVSVSRQMGKTNLLIHAKRKLENKINRYVFIDITNQFQTSQDCFRYIIDQIIDANEDVEEIVNAGVSIRQKRLPHTMNPTKEYQDELRTILKFFKGNLVVFLDEVDDLRKHDFSDEIFAQIRKNYFIRVTYPEFDRLSYVLSGVIDPEKLIKNKDNSPFNIAIPIYLDDFSKREFEELISKSDMILEDDTIDYIYDWLKGNPRMSFDVLSKLEDEYISGSKIDSRFAEDVIYDIYLKYYKHPPIDHIRDLVKHNSEIRKAVIKIRQGLVEELSDDIKNKLYLFGIIGSRLHKEKIEIKNKVIDTALSKEWLEQIELEKTGYYELGQEKITLGLYSEAINYFNEFLHTSPTRTYLALANYNIGIAYHFKKEYTVSNSYLVKLPVSIESSSELYYQQLLYIASNYYRLGEYSESLKLCNEIIASSKEHTILISSYLTRVEILIYQQGSDKVKIEEDLNEVLNLIVQDESQKGNDFIAHTYFRLAGLNAEMNPEKSKDYYIKSLQNAKPLAKPILLLYIDSFNKEDTSGKEDTSIEISKIIIENNLRYTDEEAPLIFAEEHTFICLNNLLEFGLEEKFEELFQYQLKELNKKNLKEVDMLNSLANFCIQVQSEKVATLVYERILKHQDVSEKIKLIAFRNIGLHYNDKKDESNSSISYLEKYVELFIRNDNFSENVKARDVKAFTRLFVHYNGIKELEKSFELALAIEKYYKHELPLDVKYPFIIVLYLIMDYYTYKGKVNDSLLYSEKILDAVKDLKELQSDLTHTDRDFLKQVEKLAKNVRNDHSKIAKQIKPYRLAERERGRNEWVKARYKNGNIISGKFKKFKDDLEKGECIIVD